MFLNSYCSILCFGLAIAITSCTNPGNGKQTKVIVTQPTSNPDPAVIVPPAPTPLFGDAPISPIPQTPKRSKPSPIATNSGDIPIIIEGSPLPNTEPIIVPSIKPSDLDKNDTVETEVKDSLESEFGININSLKCPNITSLSQGKSVNCQVVTFDGNFSVKLTNAGEQFEYQPQGIVMISDLESSIEASILKTRGKDVRASCVGEVLIFRRGDYLNCQVVDRNNKATSALVSFKNLNGNSEGIKVSLPESNSNPLVNRPRPQNNTALKPAPNPPSILQNQPRIIAATQNSQKLEKSLKSLLTKEIGMNIKAVNCPDRVEKNFTKIYNCQAVTGRGNFALAVKLVSPQGSFKYQAKGVLLPRKLSKLISQEVENSTGKQVEVDCGENVIFFQAGETLGCQISTGRGEPQNIKVTIQDSEGKKVKVNYSLAG